MPLRATLGCLETTTKYEAFSSVLVQGKPCTKNCFFVRSSYEKAFFCTMGSLKKVLKGNQ